MIDSIAAILNHRHDPLNTMKIDMSGTRLHSMSQSVVLRLRGPTFFRN